VPAIETTPEGMITVPTICATAHEVARELLK
jgi:hypothetical protein